MQVAQAAAAMQLTASLPCLHEDARDRTRRLGCLRNRAALRVCLALLLLAPLVAQHRGAARQLAGEGPGAVKARAGRPRERALREQPQGQQEALRASQEADCPTEVGGWAGGCWRRARWLHSRLRRHS